jgi:thioredoxin 1
MLALARRERAGRIAMSRVGTIAAIGALVACVACGGDPTTPATPASPTPTPNTGPVLVLTAANFEAEVANNPGTVMVEFYSPTCPACLSMAEIVEQVAQDFAGRAVVGTVNTAVERDLLDQYKIRVVPTFVFIKAGSEVDRYSGTATRSQLSARIESAIAS